MNLNIRKMERKDFEPLYQLLSDGEVMRYMEEPFSREKTEQFLYQAGLSDPPLIYAVENEKKEFAGYVIYHKYEEDSVEIGWVLQRECWGKGYASCLTEMLVKRAFSEKKNVIIECSPEQVATKSIAIKYGFSYIGRKDNLDVYRLMHL